MLSIYKKLLILFSSIKKIFIKQKTKIKNDPNTSIDTSDIASKGSLMFILDNENVLILINIPDTTNKTSEQIVDLAENYANFILGISNHTMYTNILSLLEERISTDDNLSNKLFVENVLHFAPILKNELEKQVLSSYINNTEPVVRPTSVFKYAIK